MCNQRLQRLYTFLILVGLFVSTPASGQQIFKKVKDDFRDLGKAIVDRHPRSGRDTAIECLAREIDWLEAHINRYGSVVAKQPDIWGESRLTKFRSEYENELYKRICAFQVRDNARILRSDVAFLASATGISAAIDAGASMPPVSLSAAQAGSPEESDGTTITPGDISQTINVTKNAVADRGSLLSASSSLEVTEELNQLSRYINHLHQLRRINTGDDTSDAPGYAMNLVRIPISITPRTRNSARLWCKSNYQPHVPLSVILCFPKRFAVWCSMTSLTSFPCQFCNLPKKTTLNTHAPSKNSTFNIMTKSKESKAKFSRSEDFPQRCKPECKFGECVSNWRC